MDKNFRNGIAMLLAVALLAGNAHAADQAAADETTQDASISDANLERAREAQRAAADEAVEAVQDDTRLDLDIRLIGPTSVKIAADF